MTMTESSTNLAPGRIVAIAGPVVDVEFPRGELPEINFAVEFDVEIDGKTTVVMAEVAQHLGGGRVRAVALKPTDGLRRGQVVRNRGTGITVPVGDVTLGHIWNVIGEPLDVPADSLEITERWPIHRDASSVSHP